MIKNRAQTGATSVPQTAPVAMPEINKKKLKKARAQGHWCAANSPCSKTEKQVKQTRGGAVA